MGKVKRISKKIAALVDDRLYTLKQDISEELTEVNRKLDAIVMATKAKDEIVKGADKGPVNKPEPEEPKAKGKKYGEGVKTNPVRGHGKKGRKRDVGDTGPGATEQKDPIELDEGK